MTWEKVEEVFDAARRLQGGARVAYLEAHCAGDAAIREEVV